METEVLHLANKILLHVGQCSVVHTLAECNSILFCHFYETFSGNSVPDTCRKTGGTEALKCQTLVDTLAQHLRPHVTLEHIKGVDLACGDALAIKHLLDIFALLLHVPEENPEVDTAAHFDTLSSKGPAAVSESVFRNLDLSNTSHFLSIEPLSPSLSIETVTDCQPSSPHPPSTIQSPAHTPTSHKLNSPLLHSTPHTTTKSRVFCPMPAHPVAGTYSGGRSSTQGHPPTPQPPLDPKMSAHQRDKDQARLLSAGNEGAEVKKADEEERRRREEEEEEKEEEEAEEETEEEEEDGEEGDEEEKEDGDTVQGAESATGLSRDAVLSLLCQTYINEHKKREKVHHSKHKRLQRTPSRHDRSGSSFPTAGNDILTFVQEAFPGIHTSPATLRKLWQKQLKQITSLTKPNTEPIRKVAQVSEQHKSLLQLIRKDLEHTRRMQRQRELKQQQQAVRTSLHNRRLAAARARRYYNEYELRLKAKLQKRRTKEEQVFRQAFEELLELQKERVREVKKYSREKQQERTRSCNQQMEALENFYKDQLLMLAESVVREKVEVEVRQKAQHQLMTKLRQELGHKMEEEISKLQGCLDREDDIVHFRQLDADRLAGRLGTLKFT